MTEQTHDCGFIISASMRYCGGCGKQLHMKYRDESEVKAMITLTQDVLGRCYDLSTTVAGSYIIRVLEWVLGDNTLPPKDLLERIKAAYAESRKRGPSSAS